MLLVPCVNFSQSNSFTFPKRLYSSKYNNFNNKVVAEAKQKRGKSRETMSLYARGLLEYRYSNLHRGLVVCIEELIEENRASPTTLALQKYWYRVVRVVQRYRE